MKAITGFTVYYEDGTEERFDRGEDQNGYVATHTISKLTQPYQQTVIAHITLSPQEGVTA